MRRGKALILVVALQPPSQVVHASKERRRTRAEAAK
jgi:hypothetical protein